MKNNKFAFNALLKKDLKIFFLNRQVLFAIIIIVGLVVWMGATLVSDASNLLTSLKGYFEKGYVLVQDFISKIDFTN